MKQKNYDMILRCVGIVASTGASLISSYLMKKQITEVVTKKVTEELAKQAENLK